MDQQALEKELAKLDGWEIREEKLFRELQFSSFMTAMQYMQDCAPVCEKLDHHPEWFNCYNRVSIWLTTHDAGAITQKDFTLAQAFERLYQNA